MDYEKVDDSPLRQQQLFEMYLSFENEIPDSQKMHESCSLNQLQLDFIQLENGIMDYEKVDDATLSQQLSEIYQPFENGVPDSQKMDTSAPNQQQLDRIQSLEDEGLVDRNFRICYLLKEECGPSFFQDLVPIFLKDARAVMRNLAKALESSVVDFDVLNMSCLKLKGSSACIGACKISNECAVFIEAIDKKSKAECLRVLGNIKKEYHDFRRKSRSIVELEKELVSAKNEKS